MVLHDALAADIWELALTAANLCDAGADILTLEALGADADAEAFREAVEAMNENDILGVPVDANPNPNPRRTDDDAAQLHTKQTTILTTRRTHDDAAPCNGVSWLSPL